MIKYYYCNNIDCKKITTELYVKKLDAITHFGTTIAVASALEISQPAVSHWGEIIPEKQAFRLDRLTGGKLVYNPDLYRTAQSAQLVAVA